MAHLLPMQLQTIMFASSDSRIGEPSPYFSTLTLHTASLSPWMGSTSLLEGKIKRSLSGQYRGKLGKRMLSRTRRRTRYVHVHFSIHHLNSLSFLCGPKVQECDAEAPGSHYKVWFESCDAHNSSVSHHHTDLRYGHGSAQRMHKWGLTYR